MRARDVVIGAVCAGVLGMCGLWWRAAYAEPTPTDPYVLSLDEARCVVDMLSPPQRAMITAFGDTRDLPGVPQRYLITTLAGGEISIGWSHSPGADPTEVFAMQRRAKVMETYVDHHRGHLVVVEARMDWDPGKGRDIAEIRCER